MSFTQGNKPTSALTQTDRTSVVANLWSEDNTPWDPDNSQPWEDEVKVVETYLNNGTKKITTFTNQNKN